MEKGGGREGKETGRKSKRKEKVNSFYVCPKHP